MSHSKQNIQLNLSEPELFGLPNAKASLIEEIISIARINDKVNQLVTIWDAIMLYGYLCSKVNTLLIRTYFNDAETAIINAINRNPRMSEAEFRHKVTMEIDFAYQRSLNAMDNY